MYVTVNISISIERDDLYHTINLYVHRSENVIHVCGLLNKGCIFTAVFWSLCIHRLINW